MPDVRAGDWDAAWSAALDELELTLEQTEALLRGELPEETPSPWTPPALSGALPVHLVGRAQSLFSRQQELIRQTAAAAAGAKQQLSLLSKVGEIADARRPERSIYVDVSA
jgi:hypothetical protein